MTALPLEALETLNLKKETGSNPSSWNWQGVPRLQLTWVVSLRQRAVWLPQCCHPPRWGCSQHGNIALGHGPCECHWATMTKHRRSGAKLTPAHPHTSLEWETPLMLYCQYDHTPFHLAEMPWYLTYRETQARVPVPLQLCLQSTWSG